MRILLTGGAGYIGSACLRWLLQNGHEAVAFDDLSAGNAAAVPDGRLLVGDILDTDRLADALCEFEADAVMHFAAKASVPDSVRDPQAYYRANVAGTQSVLDAMLRAGVRRIVFSSTAAVYGYPEETPITENTPTAPRTPYGATKLAAEWMIRDYAAAYGLGYTTFRYFNAAGADPDGRFGECRPDEAHLIPLALGAALGHRTAFRLCGDDYPTRDGTCVRDFVHTHDLAQAHQLGVESTKPGTARVYNLGTGTGFSVREVLAACARVAGRTVPYAVAPRRSGDPATLVACPRKAREELGWRPRFGRLEDIIETAARWHRERPEGYGTAVPAGVGA